MIGKAAIGKWAIGKAPVTASSGGAVTVAPTTGGYTYTGNTPAISQPRTLAPAIGSYAYLGNTPEVSQIAGIRPTTGGYVYAGNTPTISQSAGVSLSPEDLAAIAAAVWASAEAVAAHAKLDAILVRITC